MAARTGDLVFGDTVPPGSGEVATGPEFFRPDMFPRRDNAAPELPSCCLRWWLRDGLSEDRDKRRISLQVKYFNARPQRARFGRIDGVADADIIVVAEFRVDCDAYYVELTS